MASVENDKKSHLTTYIIGSIIGAILLSILLPHVAMKLSIGGEIFLRLLQMIVVPLVMASVMSGILGLGDIRKLGRPGGYAVVFYLSTTIIAVITGLVMVNIIRPGVSIDRTLVEDAAKEGASAVEQAAHTFDPNRRKITWSSPIGPDHVLLDAKTGSGTSDAITVPSDESTVVAITIEQVGEATTPAYATVLWTDETEEDYQSVKYSDGDEERDRFEAGSATGAYTRTMRIPPAARKIKIVYEAQSGGEVSTIRAHLSRAPPTTGDILENLVLMLFTENLLGSMVEVNLLPIILFSIVFAGMMTTMGARSEIIANFVVAINDALMSFVLLLMKLAPIGIFCLVAGRFGKAQAEGQFLALLQIQFYYMFTVLSGLFIHALITLPLILWVFTRRNPYRFMYQMSQAILTAFSTASSTATLPITMECAEINAGVSKRSTEFVLPLGATINMDGTALYEAAAAIFIAQAYAVVNPDFDLSMTQQITVAVTATLAAIGAAGIPEAGLVTMLIVLNAVQLPLELIGLILPVDWLLDRFRTAVNAFGDSVGSAIVDRSFRD